MTPGERESFSWTNFRDVLGSGRRREGQTTLSSQQGQKERVRREAGPAQNNFSLCGDLSENKLPLELHRSAAAANMTPGLRNTRSPADKRKKGVKITSCQCTLKLIFMHSERDRL